MSILNQSFTPSGHQPVFAANSTSSPDISRNLPLHGLPNSFKSLQPPQNLFFNNPIKPELLRDVGELGLSSSSSSSPSSSSSSPEKLDSTAATTTMPVFVSSAVALERKQIDKIAKKMRRMTGVGDLRMENVIDSTLIAGFVIRYDDDEGRPKVIDLSVKGQLAELANRIETSDKQTDEQEQSWGLTN